MRPKRPFQFAIAAIVLLAAIAHRPAQAAEPATQPTKAQAAKSPLAGLPSAPGPHIDKIKALGDGEWLNLGQPAADPKWGRAPGRSYTPKMAFAPDLGGAFLAGEGQHGATAKRGGGTHNNDDLFFYDINQHRWICLYPGADVNNLNMTLDKNGWEVTADGEPIPVSQLGHGYEQLEYISHLRKFMFVPAHKLLWPNHVVGKKRLSWLKDPADPHLLADPRYYDAATGRWERQNAVTIPTWAEKNTTNRTECGALVYSPKSRKIIFLCAHRDLWLYDYDKAAWSALKPAGSPPNGGYEGVICLDTKRDRIYCCNNDPTFPKVYDIASNTWLDIKPEGEPLPAKRRVAASPSAILTYDSVNDVAVLLQYGNEDQKDRGVYIYDPAKNAWAAAPVALPPNWGHRLTHNGFYDPELNAHFIHEAGDSWDNGVIWVFRYKRAAK